MAASLTSSGLDDRVTDDGRPVTRVRLVRGWFVIQRAGNDPLRVELITRIPGCRDEVTRHDSQADAEQSASETYAAYCAACRAPASPEQETGQ